MKVWRIFIAMCWVLFMVFGAVREAAAQTCGGGPVFCAAPPGTCSNDCICSAQDCRTCSGWGCPTTDFGGQCISNKVYDSHGNLISYTCDTSEVYCTNNPSGGSCPGYINPCCTPCNGDPSCSSGGGGGGGGGSPTPTATPATHLECIGNSCTTVSGSGVNQCATSPDCTTTYSVSGTVYLGSATWDGTSCVSGSGTALLPGAGSTVRINSGYVPIQANGTYSSTINTGISVFTILPSDSIYSVVCPPGGVYSLNITGNTSGINYYLSDAQGAWWQVRGGDVGANGGTISSAIPATCTGSCKAFVTLLDTGLTADSSGVTWLANPPGSYGAGAGNMAEGTDYQALGSGIRVTSRKESYDYFYRLFELGLSPTQDSFNEADMLMPTGSPSDGKYAHFFAPSSGTAQINTAWDLNPGDSLVIFVDGNLQVNAPIVTDVGDFVAFVVSGNITFNVGNAGAPANPPTATVEGVFIADGLMTTSAGAQQFAGEGMFIGWGGVDMNRDFGDNTNNTFAADFFTYRPDFLTNAPLRMKRPVIRWEEVAP